ncbi:hypothetical protein ACLB1R_34775 [Escherichia coli]
MYISHMMNWPLTIKQNQQQQY